MTIALSKEPFVVTEKNIHQVMDLHPEQVIHAFKFTTLDGRPPTFQTKRGRIRYRAGRVTSQKKCCTDREKTCGVGLHVATRAWCHRAMPPSTRPARLLFLVRFKRKDVGVVPYMTQSSWDHATKIPNRYYDGKFRVRRMLVVRRVEWNDGGTT